MECSLFRYVGDNLTTYESVANARGAGKLKGEEFVVYRNRETNEHFVRHPGCFDERMIPLNDPLGEIPADTVWSVGAILNLGVTGSSLDRFHAKGLVLKRQLAYSDLLKFKQDAVDRLTARKQDLHPDLIRYTLVGILMEQNYVSVGAFVDVMV